MPQVGGGSAQGISQIGAASQKAQRGVGGLAKDSNILRGALIGISRVTPVTVFGLGLAGTAGIAVATALRQAVGSAAQFEEQLNIFRVVSGATADEMERVSQVAKDLGRDVSLPAVSAVDATAALTELAKAGLTVRDAIGATRGTLELAAAANIDNAEAARIASSALNAFALAGPEATRVADLLAASSVAAQGEITDMAAALQQASAVAKQAGIPIEDTVTAISLLAKAGLLGSDAGTSLRTTILRLTPTTKEASQFVRALGISFADQAGNVRTLPEIFEQYRVKLAQLPPVLRQVALTQIFGQDAIRAASIFARGGAAAFEEMSLAVERQGVASELAGARAEGLSGSFRGLISNLETAALTSGQVLAPALKLVVDGLSAVTSASNATDEAVARFFSNVEGRVEDFVTGFVPGAGESIFQSFTGSREDVAALQNAFDELRLSSGEFLEHLRRFSTEEGDFLVFARGIEELVGEFDNINDATAQLDQVADGLRGGDVEARRLANTLDAVVRLFAGLGRAPTELELRVFLNTGEFQQEVKKTQNDLIKAAAKTKTEFDDALARVGGYFLATSRCRSRSPRSSGTRNRKKGGREHRQSIRRWSYFRNEGGDQ